MIMPRPFSEEEKERIRKLLLEKGKELFSHYGIKKTGIGELAEAVGIAQGSFYLFFNSKEELYFAVLEMEEQEIRDKFFKWLMDGGKITRAKFKEFLRLALKVFEDNPLIRRLWLEGEIEDLMRRLPPELMERHAKRDTSALEPLIRQWQDEGSLVEGSPETIAGVIRSLFLLLLHSREIGEEIFPEVIDMYINLIADGLVKE
jgi:AcrR family transcriptional regulator